MRQSMTSQAGCNSPLARVGGPSPMISVDGVPSELRQAVKTRFIKGAPVADVHDWPLPADRDRPLRAPKHWSCADQAMIEAIAIAKDGMAVLFNAIVRRWIQEVDETRLENVDV